MNTILLTVLLMGGLGILAAAVLFAVAKKFNVAEDPRIADVEELLPGANCGGCGYSGCHAFAVACCTASSLDGMACPGAGPVAMRKIADIVGLAPSESVARIALVRCQGSCSLRPQTSVYDGTRSCAIEAAAYAGTTDCAYGCLGCGDCVEACPYDAMRLDPETGLPVVLTDRCVGCGKCVKACPRGIIELACANEVKSHVWVACMNRDRGPVAMKECEVSCIGCGKCVKVCPAQAVAVNSFVARINPTVCTGCEACVEACPRKSILTTAHGQTILTRKADQL